MFKSARFLFVCLSVAFFALNGRGISTAQPKQNGNNSPSDKFNLSETFMDQWHIYTSEEARVISPDMKRIAYGLYKGENKKWVVMVDGVAGREIDNLAEKTLMFSLDSKRVAYVAKRGERDFATVDGVEGKEYHAIVPTSLIFSPDSQHVAYVAYGENRKCVMVMDGVESKEYDGIDYAETLLIFSLDSKRVAFVAQHGDKHCAVVDGVNGMDYDYIAPRTLNFSPDSKHVAYIARRGNKSVVVIDGVEGKEYEGIGDALVFSPDSTRVAYVVWHGRNKQVMVVDGAEGKEYESVGSPIFSPDSKRVVYTAWREKKTFMVIDGVEGKEYDGIGYKSDGVSGRFQSIGARRSVFSPDSQHYAYTAWRGDKWFVVVDGVESKEYNGIGDSLIFSPDSKRLAYAVRSGRQACVVINGREGPGYQGVLSPIFSPDSKRVAYIAYDYNSSHMTIVADGLPPIGFDDIFQGSLTFSPDSKHFAFCAEISDGHLTIVIDGIQSKDFDFDNISYPVFESSSKLRVMITRHFVKDHNYKLFRLDIEIPN